MNVISSLCHFIVPLVMVGMVYAAGEVYRVAGIIAPTDTGWLAVIELPTGEQRLVRVGDEVGEAKVLHISKGEVLLEFKDGTRLLQLASAESAPRSKGLEPAGVLANSFRDSIQESHDLADSGELPGLVDMDQLPSDMRIVSINGQAVSSVAQGLDLIRNAINNDHLIRLTLEEGAMLPVLYLRPGEEAEFKESNR
jgi:hypothetical protein